MSPHRIRIAAIRSIRQRVLAFKAVDPTGDAHPPTRERRRMYRAINLGGNDLAELANVFLNDRTRPS